MIRDAPLGLARVVQEAAEENAENPAVASAAVVSKVSKREERSKETYLRGAKVRGGILHTAFTIYIEM